MKGLDGVAVESTSIEPARNSLVPIDQNGIDSTHKSWIAARQQFVLYHHFTFQNVDAYVIIFIDGKCDRGRINGGDDRNGAEHSLLQLSRSGIEMNAHAPGHDIEQVTGGGWILPERYLGVCEHFEAASAIYLEVRVAVAAGCNEPLNRYVLAGTDGPGLLITLDRDLALRGGDVSLITVGEGWVERWIPCLQASGSRKRCRDDKGDCAKAHHLWSFFHRSGPF